MYVYMSSFRARTSFSLCVRHSELQVSSVFFNPILSSTYFAMICSFAVQLFALGFVHQLVGFPLLHVV